MSPLFLIWMPTYLETKKVDGTSCRSFICTKKNSIFNGSLRKAIITLARNILLRLSLISSFLPQRNGKIRSQEP